jgi:hypothetical protein
MIAILRRRRPTTGVLSWLTCLAIGLWSEGLMRLSHDVESIRCQKACAWLFRAARPERHDGRPRHDCRLTEVNFRTVQAGCVQARRRSRSRRCYRARTVDPWKESLVNHICRRQTVRKCPLVGHYRSRIQTSPFLDGTQIMSMLVRDSAPTRPNGRGRPRGNI